MDSSISGRGGPARKGPAERTGTTSRHPPCHRGRDRVTMRTCQQRCCGPSAPVSSMPPVSSPRRAVRRSPCACRPATSRTRSGPSSPPSGPTLVDRGAAGRRDPGGRRPLQRRHRGGGGRGRRHGAGGPRDPARATATATARARRCGSRCTRRRATSSCGATPTCATSTPAFVVGPDRPAARPARPGLRQGLLRAPRRRPVDDRGGRVTELVARPIVSLLFPHLAPIVQPLAGEYAGRREALEQLPVRGGLRRRPRACSSTWPPASGSTPWPRSTWAPASTATVRSTSSRPRPPRCCRPPCGGPTPT